MGNLIVAVLALLPSPTAITMEGHVLRVPVALENLSRITGQKYACTDDLKERVVYAEAHGMDIKDVEAGLAQALDGSWSKNGDTMVLKADVAARNVRRKAFTDKTVLAMKQTIDAIRMGFPAKFDSAAALDLKKKFDVKPDPNDFTNYRQRESLSFGTPVGRLLFDLLGSMDLSQVAMLDGQRFALYSNKRSKLFTLTSFAAPRLKQYDAEQAVWDGVFETSRNDGQLSSSNFAAERSGTQLPVDRVCLAIGRYSALPNFFVSLALFDQYGTVKGIARFNVFLQGFDQVIAPPDRGGRENDPVITLSPRAKKYLGAFAFEPNDARLPAGDPMYSQILDPVQNEPLDFWAGELAHSFGMQTGGNTFACLDDGLYWDLNAVINAGQVSAAALEETLKTRSQYEFTREGGYTVVRQANPDRADQYTIARSALSEFTRELDKNGFLSFESLVRFAEVESRTNTAGPLLFLHTRAVVPGYERVLQFIDMPSLDILGTLTPREREALFASGSITVGALSPPSVSSLNAMLASREVWDSRGPMNVLIPGELRVPLLMPDGAPPSLTLQIKTNGDKGLAVWNAPYDDFAAWYNFGNPERTVSAISQFMRKQVPFKFWYGSAIDVTMTATLNGETIGSTDLFAPMFDMRKPASKVEELPENLQRTIKGG